MTRIIFSAAVLAAVAAVAAGCSSGAQDAGPVPSEQGSGSTSSSQGTVSASTSTGSTSTSTAALPLCKDKTATVKVVSQQGATGSILTIWRVTNTSSSSCRSFGYPGMDFRADGRWLDVQVQRGGVDIINQAPVPVVVEPEKSLYFVSLWGDADTQAGPCKQFDRVKVTLPDNFTSAQVDSSGCVDPDLVRVGPVRQSLRESSTAKGSGTAQSQ